MQQIMYKFIYSKVTDSILDFQNFSGGKMDGYL